MLLFFNPFFGVSGAFRSTRLPSLFRALQKKKCHFFALFFIDIQVTRTRRLSLRFSFLRNRFSVGHKCSVAYAHVLRVQISLIVLAVTAYSMATGPLLPLIKTLICLDLMERVARSANKDILNL